MNKQTYVAVAACVAVLMAAASCGSKDNSDAAESSARVALRADSVRAASNGEIEVRYRWFPTHDATAVGFVRRGSSIQAFALIKYFGGWTQAFKATYCLSVTLPQGIRGLKHVSRRPSAAELERERRADRKARCSRVPTQMAPFTVDTPQGQRKVIPAPR